MKVFTVMMVFWSFVKRTHFYCCNFVSLLRVQKIFKNHKSLIYVKVNLINGIYN